MASLNQLPVELIHKIFDYLDSETIVCSLRCVCKKLYQCVQSYSQYDFNFESISKTKFEFLCNYIDLNNVYSLKLSDDNRTAGQIEYFLSLYRLNQFRQLRSLNIYEIDQCYLNIILKDIQSEELKSFEIETKKDFQDNNWNSVDLQRILTRKKLKKFSWKFSNFNYLSIQWPVNCSIKILTINCFHLNEFYYLVQSLPNLLHLQIENFNDNSLFSTDLKGFIQLKTLIIKCSSIDFHILLNLLSLTLTIEYLQIKESIDLNEFLSNLIQFEDFLKTTLILLKNFEFFLIDRQHFLDPSIDIQRYLRPFRNHFWITIKQWFVICDFIQSPRTICLYTSKFINENFEFIYQNKHFIRSSSIPKLLETNQINHVQKLYFDLTKSMPFITSNRGGLPKFILFGNLNELRLNIGDQWPLGSLRFLSNLILFDKITKLTLTISNSFSISDQSMINIQKLFELTKNIQELKLYFLHHYSNYYNDDLFKRISSLIPSYLKYLTIQVANVEQMNYIYDRMRSCLSITFENPNSNYYGDMSNFHIEFLEQSKKNFNYKLTSSSLSIWIRQKNFY